MENPATWSEAEHVVNEAYHDWHKSRESGIVGLSLARRITDSLRRAGLLIDGERTEFKEV